MGGAQDRHRRSELLSRWHVSGSPTLAMRAPWISAIVLIGCGGEEIAREREAIEAVCYDEEADSGWKCGESRAVECGDPLTLYVPRAWAFGECEELVASPNVTWPPGEVQIEVLRRGVGESICSADLTIRDTVAPRLEPRINMIVWPPNHRWVELSPHDCVDVFDRCDDDVRV